MASLYTDENVPIEVADTLRQLGHDVLTALDDGRANQGIDDPDVLTRPTQLGRAVVTNNRGDYHRLHRLGVVHAGVITYTYDPDSVELARRIHAAIASLATLQALLIRIVRPNPSRKP